MYVCTSGDGTIMIIYYVCTFGDGIKASGMSLIMLISTNSWAPQMPENLMLVSREA